MPATSLQGNALKEYKNRIAKAKAKTDTSGLHIVHKMREATSFRPFLQRGWSSSGRVDLWAEPQTRSVQVGQRRSTSPPTASSGLASPTMASSGLVNPRWVISPPRGEMMQLSPSPSPRAQAWMDKLTPRTVVEAGRGLRRRLWGDQSGSAAQAWWSRVDRPRL